MRSKVQRPPSRLGRRSSSVTARDVNRVKRSIMMESKSAFATNDDDARTSNVESRRGGRCEDDGCDGGNNTTVVLRCVDGADDDDDAFVMWEKRYHQDDDYSVEGRNNRKNAATAEDDDDDFTFAIPTIDVHGDGDSDANKENEFVRNAWMRTVEACEARIRRASSDSYASSGARSPTRGIQGEYAKKCAAELALGRVDDAMESAEKCVEVAPFWYKGFVLLAEARMALKTPLAEEARRDLERAAFLEPRARADARFEELVARVIGSV